ncbi:hypothetical protein EBR21_09305, partial [bacterium]|nr:hypothetical protein [bacterium]
MSKLRPDVHLQNKAKGFALVTALFAHGFAIANETTPTNPPANPPAAEQGLVKSFNEVLQDLVNEFSFDLRAKALNTLRNVSIRRVALGEGIPRTYESYLETQVA